MKLSVVIIAFKSFHLLEKLIISIPESYEIIIIENSLDKQTKLFEQNFKNVQVILPDENLGFSKSVNLGIRVSQNNFVCFLSPDVILPKECLENLEKIIIKLNNFALISPTYIDESIHKNYQIKNVKLLKDIEVENFQLKEVDEVDGSMFVLNKSNIDNKILMDENFFLYFESTDACIQLRKNKKKIYAIKNLKYNHLGTKSSDPIYSLDIKINRNWHFSWSKFYLLKKHFGYSHALRKTIPNFLRAIKVCTICILKNDNDNFKINKAILLGLINSYFLKKSSYRPFNYKESN